ncbi:hypothetical protein [Yersinia kristensenii]|uniref:Uncharacterized protein n=1 Tax=Yersinia kristensenii TaxID=28152 RepID=A0A0T9L9S8_YERKR|nr:hypothetical protein [Yersinia kristensenii]CNE70983.1 Uncharacterised protein [Yersinia kristensenii]
MLDFFKELFAAMRTTAVERIKSPVIGALCFSWLVFNWDNILTILFSTATIEVKIGMVKANSTILTTMVWPILSTGLITILLPTISAVVIWIQNKPTMFSMEKYAIRNDAILDRKIETEKKRARADIAYDREKTGEEEKIQKMREDIEISKEKTGEITKEKDELITEKKALISEKNNLIVERNALISEKEIMLEMNNKLSQDMIELALQLDETRTKLRMANRNDDLNKVTLGMPSTMQHQDKE